MLETKLVFSYYSLSFLSLHQIFPVKYVLNVYVNLNLKFNLRIDFFYSAEELNLSWSSCLKHVLCLQLMSAAAGSSVEEEEDEESHFSEGQLVAASAQSDSDDSDISEEIIQGEEILISIDW